MKTIVSIILALLSFYSSKSHSPQIISVENSEQYFNYSSTSLHKIFGHDNAHFYVLKRKGQRYLIQKHQLYSDLSLVREEYIKLHERLKNYDLESVVHFGDEIIVFASRRSLNDITLYYRKINKDSLLHTEKFKQLIKIRNIKGSWADFHFQLSRRKTKLLIACRTKLYWSKVQYNEFYVYREGINLDWEKKDYYEFEKQGPRDNKYIVDEYGHLSVLSLIERENIMDLFREVKNVYQIYRYTNNGDNFKKYPVTFNDKYIRGISIVAGNKGDVVCTGLYSNMYRDGIKGSFFFRIDSLNNQISQFSFQPFQDNLIRKMEKLNEPFLAEDELIQYELTDLFIQKSGRIIMIAEQFFEQNFNTYNNLIINSFNPSGELFWAQVIPKRQDFPINFLDNFEQEPENYREYLISTGIIHSSIINYSSYGLMTPLDKNEIVIFFNDHKKNIKQDEKIHNFNNPRKSYTAAIRIDEYGNMLKEELVHWKRREPFPVVLRLYDTLEGIVIIPAFKGRKYTYYRVMSP